MNAHSTKEALAADAARRLDCEWSAEDLERNLDGMKRRARRATLGRRVAVATTLTAAAAAALFFVRTPTSETAENALSEQAEQAEETAPERTSEAIAVRSNDSITFADGSSVRPSEDAQVRVDEVSDRRMQVALARGAVDVEVTPRPERSFTVVAGEVRVVVLGTRFRVERFEETTRVAVERGRVRVEWEDGSTELSAGETGDFPPPPEPPEPPTTESPTPTRSQRDWRALANRGGYDEAYAVLRTQGAGAVRDQVDDLLLAADTARLSGNPRRALRYLRAVVERHGRDRRAPMAAFTGGRLELAAGHADVAATLFERANELGARGSLRENAIARAVEAHSRAGNAGRARALATQYVERYPEGRWTSVVRSRGGLE